MVIHVGQKYLNYLKQYLVYFNTVQSCNCKLYFYQLQALSDATR